MTRYKGLDHLAGAKVARPRVLCANANDSTNRNATTRNELQIAMSIPRCRPLSETLHQLATSTNL
jgi:hypothetical protein